MEDLRQILYKNNEIKKEIGNAKCLLYGFNRLSKCLLIELMYDNIYVDGFLISDKFSDLTKIKYLNKRIYSFEDVSVENGEYVIIDAWGNNINFIKSKIHNTIKLFSYFKCTTQYILIWGAGEYGKKAYEFFKKINVETIAFLDIDKLKQNKNFCGKSIISPREALEKYNEYPIIIAINDIDAVKDVDSLLSKRGYPIYCKYDDISNIWDLSENIFLSKGKKHDNKFIYPNVLYYHIRHLEQDKKLILFGFKQEILQVANIFFYLDMPIYRAAVLDKNFSYSDNAPLPFCRPSDLLYEDSSHFVILVLYNAKQIARKFAIDYGLDMCMFYMLEGSSSGIKYDHILDVNLGYNVHYKKQESVIRVSNKKNEKIKIGIVGGSTSDVTLYNEKSWPEYLQEIVDINNINAVVMSGAVCGYISSQETVKFIRDLLPLGIDILISYSGYNDLFWRRNYSPFVHPYQYDIFKILENMQKNNYNLPDPSFETNTLRNDVYFGRANETLINHWLNQERILHAICHEFGIKFYSILQPFLFQKKNMTVKDIELKEHNTYTYNSHLLKDFELIKTSILKFQSDGKGEYFIDFSNIFDTIDKDVYTDLVHLTSYGNNIVARKIFEIIKKNL